MMDMIPSKLASKIKFYLKVGGLAAFALPGIGLQWLFVRLRLPQQTRFPVLFHRYAARVIGLKRVVVGKPSNLRPLMLVSNHVSWLDVVALSSVCPLSFIAKSEVRGWGVFGLFARLQRSVFVDRQRRSATKTVNDSIAERLKSGDVMVLFGEGTTGDGVRVLPFKSSLLGAARDAMNGSVDESGVWLQPVSIAYTKLGGLPAGRFERPHTAWYGDMELLPHLRTIFISGPLDVTISFGEPERFETGTDRKQLARRLEVVSRGMTSMAHLGRRPEIGL